MSYIIHSYIKMFLMKTCLQENRIVFSRGKGLSEEDNKLFVGLIVSVKGKSTGTQTDARGEFSINVANGNVLAHLVFQPLTF